MNKLIPINQMLCAASIVLASVWSCLGAAADAIGVPLPQEVTLNKNAGRGAWVIVKVRLESGEELPFVVDTGSPMTLFDPSLASKLGKRQMTINFSSPAGGKQDAGIYAAPKLLLGGVPLHTGSYVATYRLGHSAMGIIGMDCLRHYCIQLDFVAGKMRFLEPAQVHAAELGKCYPLVFPPEEAPPLLAKAGQELTVSFIHQAGLLGGTDTNLLVDTGDNVDGAVQKGAIQGHYGTRFLHFLVKARAARPPSCEWDGETYTGLRIVPNMLTNRLGLRFLGRHLVTFDFPDQQLYLKKVSSGPLPRITTR